MPMTTGSIPAALGGGKTKDNKPKDAGGKSSYDPKEALGKKHKGKLKGEPMAHPDAPPEAFPVGGAAFQ